MQFECIPEDLAYSPKLYEWLADARAKAPICRIRNHGGSPAWLVTGHAEAREALAHSLLSSDPSKHGAATQSLIKEGLSLRIFPQTVLTSDPPAHAQFRRSMAPAFTVQKMKDFHKRMDRLAAKTVDLLPREGPADLVSEIAEPVGMKTTAAVLGIPDDEITREIIRWSHDLMAEPTGRIGVERSRQGEDAIENYLNRLLAKGVLHDGLLRKWFQGTGHARLPRDVSTPMAILMAVASHHNSVGLLASAMRHLLCDQQIASALRKQPDGVANAIEEIIRFDGPVVTVFRRFALSDLTIGETCVHRGDQVVISIAGANHDPRTFVNPTTIDVNRSPNPHIGFGHGIHYCPGVRMARVQVGIVIRALLNHPSAFRLAVPADQLRWHSGKARSLQALPVMFDPISLR